nr:SDR family oxidoreductase [Actinomycetales bacterium]
MTTMRPWPGDDAVAQHSSDPFLSELVAATRLLGEDPALVLHGGGNSSVKSTVRDITGREVPVLHMKASGSSMEDAAADSFTALDLSRLRELLPPTVLTDEQFEREVRAAQFDPDAASPSLESLVHAALPHTAILHSHADIVVAITDTPDGEAAIQDALGPEVVVLPYGMPGEQLAAIVHRTWAEQGGPHITGLVVPRHGLFTLAATSREAYALHAGFVARVHAWVASRGGFPLPPADDGGRVPSSATGPTDAGGDGDAAHPQPSGTSGLVELARLRRAISDAAGRDMLLRLHADAEARAFTADPTLAAAATRGPITPDHATRTKGFPLVLSRTVGPNYGHTVDEEKPADAGLRHTVDEKKGVDEEKGVGRDVAGFAEEYRAYVQRNRSRRDRSLTELDPAPRLILDPERGLLVAGPSAGELTVNSDIARHWMQVVRTAESLGGYQPVSEDHVFDLEYWSLQQAKMTRGRNPRPLDGQVAIVTGAASGIGRACAQALLDAGCAVVGWDLNPDVASTFATPAWRGVQVDVTEQAAVEHGLRVAVEEFGGLDILVVGAGIFPTSKPIGEMELDVFRRTMAVNVDSVVTLYGLAWPLLEHSRQGGRVVVVASKNVIAPGSGAAAYSSSKAALTQLSRVAALEWAPKGIRVNLMHPDAVFDTGLWTPELLAARAAHYGLTVDEYKRRNLLKAEVTSATCGAMALAMVTEPFRCTTGAQVAIDGGSDRTI